MKTLSLKHIRFLAFLVFTIATLYTQAQSSSIRFNTNLNSHQGITAQVSETTPILTINQSDLNTFKATYSFSKVCKTSVIANNSIYDYLHIEGFAKMAEIGSPALPAHNDILIAPSNGPINVSYTFTSFDEYDGFNIHPTLADASDEEGKPEPEFQINSSVYQTNAFYPQEMVNIADVQVIRGQRIVLVQVRPVQFNPVTHKIRVYHDLSYTINFEGSKAIFDQISVKNSQKYLDANRGSFLNSNIIPKLSTAKTSAIDYLILTTNAFKAAADTLSLWKMQLGYNTVVISKESWTSAVIKDTIANRYNSSSVKPDYFVLIGDNEQMPAQMLPYNSTFYPTDLYYACMDGIQDYFPDMAHGRISVTTSTQALAVIQKIINYERNPISDPNFYSNIAVCAYFQDGTNYTSYADGYDDRRFVQTTEEVRNYLMPKGYTINRVYEAFDNRNPLFYNNGYYSNGESLPADLLKSNGFTWTGNTSGVSSNINAGRFMLVHRDHGYVGGYGWAHPQFVNIYNDINNLTNGNKLPVVFSINCYTGDFSQTECFAENFLRKLDGGAVGIFAHSSESFSGYNDALVIGLIDAIWASPGLIPNFGAGAGTDFTYNIHGNIRTMGDVMNQGLIRMMGTWVSPLRWKLTHELLHYFGDPSMKMWTQSPTTIIASIKDTLPRFSNSLTVTSNIDGALVTLIYNNQIIASALTSNGSATLNFTFTNNILGIVTISKENCRPVYKNVLIRNLISPAKPSLQASSISVVAFHAKGLSSTITWVNGSGDYRLVKMNVIENFTAPVDGQEYIANSNYLNNGEQVVYVGEGSSVTITNLTANQSYWFRVYEYNNSGVYTLYQTIETTANPVNSSGDGGVLPVSLLYFKGEFLNNEIKLNWATADETNNDFFTLEKSNNGIDFESIANINGAGNSNIILEYEFTDRQISNSLMYYRLKQTDWNGKSFTYKPIAVKPKKLENLAITQFAINSNQLKLSMNCIGNTETTARIIDINGKSLFNETYAFNPGQNTLKIGVDNLNPGVYIIYLSEGNETISQKFMKQ